MKKIILSIITIFFIFSIQSNAIAKNQDGLIENLLNLNYWPVIYDLNLEKLDSYSFNDYNLKNIYSDLVKYDKLVKTDIINSYKAWKYDYYTTNWIIRNYKSFISYTNDFFYFLKQIDKYPYLKDDVEIQDGLLTSYKNSQSYYKKVKNLVAKKVSIK